MLRELFHKYDIEDNYPSCKFERVETNKYMISFTSADSEFMAEKTTIDYLGILEYLKNNRELPYADPEKPGLTPEQKQQYLTVKKNGQNIVAE